jgi:hypothetical protein
VREQRVTTPDGRVWYVRRRWAKRRPPWRRQPDHELGPAERDALPVLADVDDLVGPLAGLVSFDPEAGPLLALALLALGALAVAATVGAIVRWVVPFVAANALPIAAAAIAVAALVLVDRLTRPWYIEAESARLFRAPRRVWRVHGWRRSRRAFRAVAAAIAEGRIDDEHGAIIF